MGRLTVVLLSCTLMVTRVFSVAEGNSALASNITISEADTTKSTNETTIVPPLIPQINVTLRAVRGRDALLPCGKGISMLGVGDFITWTKDHELLGRYPSSGSSQSRRFGLTCKSNRHCYDETSLKLKQVTESNNGTYRCRLHGPFVPAADFNVNLQLIDPPELPIIYDGNKQEIKRGYVTLNMDQDLNLTCKIEHDSSVTTLYWRRNDQVVKQTHKDSDGSLTTELYVPHVTRNELDAHYDCVVNNADVTAPTVTTIVVKMYLPAKSISINVSEMDVFEADVVRIIDCIVNGSIPPPVVSWRLAGRELNSSMHTEKHEGQYTVSSLTFVPTVLDSGHELTCRAFNRRLPFEMTVDSITLNVGVRPKCQVTRQETIGAVFGETENLTCTVSASPEPLMYTWTFSNGPAVHTYTQIYDKLEDSYSSQLTWTPTEHAENGSIHCRAFNSIGEQKEACSFKVEVGQPPDSPKCSVTASPPIMKIQCQNTWDGGRTQTFHLEILNTSGMVVYNFSNRAGQFMVPESRKNGLIAVAYTSSSRGTSERKTFHIPNTPPVPTASEAEGTRDGEAFKLIISEVAGSFLVFVAFFVMLMMSIKSIRSARETDSTEIIMNPDIVPHSDGAFHREPREEPSLHIDREERFSDANITVNELVSFPSQYSTKPTPSCRILVGSPRALSQAPTCSYYV